MSFIFLLLAIIAGVMFPIQGAVNNVLRSEVGNPFLSGALSNLVGCVIMIILALSTSHQMPLRLPETTNQNWYMWIGGIISALVVSANIVIPQRIGFSAFLSIYIVSQLIMALFIDNYGLFGSNIQTINSSTITGIIFLAIGIFFIVFKS